MLYRKNLKNREFDKEAAQIFGLERATIVRAQGASEDQKFAAQLMQSKTDSSGSFGILKLIQNLGILQGGCVKFFSGASDHCACTRRERRKKFGCNADAAKNQLLNQFRYIRLLALFILLSSLYLFAEEPMTSCAQRKTLLVLSSRGGGGHTAAAFTLQKILGCEYDVRIIYPIDQLRIWGIPSGEQIYNAMLQGGWTRAMNFIVRHIAPHLFRSREDKMEKIIDSHIKACNPDLVISLIPFVNYPASEAARKKHIPYLLVTTDNDLRHWILGLEKLKHPDFKVTIGSDLDTSRKLLLAKNVPATAIETIGLPLRPEFIVKRDESRIREELNIFDNKPITLIMMGGAGASKVYDYAKKIGGLNLSTHIIVVMGHNQKMRKELEKIQLHPSNTLTLVGFTDRIADLMAISHVIITKPGPGTINEALAMQLPILIDNTEKLLFWECVNVDMVLQYGVGQRITHSRQIQNFLETYLSDAEIKKHLYHPFVSIPPNHFHLKIKPIVEQMVAAREQRSALQDSEEKVTTLMKNSTLKAAL